ncbi:MAG: ATP-binding protein [Lachnospiraceae bacterium]|nr:ATP-binding protein [Lachnospiraceae bacterium]
MENYFVHGMRKEDSDNYLKIQVEQEDEEICVVIEDNGHGMTEAELKKKNHELAENKKSEGKHSIGIANVNRRIKMVYGNQYGLRLEHAGERGLRVILRYKPEKDVTGNEETGNKETENETQKG